MKIENFSNLYKNAKLKDRLEKVNEVNEIEKQYRMCQILLEYINVCFLTQNRKINLKNSNIITITEKYKNIDEELFRLMVKIIGLYNEYDEFEVTESDVEYLLYQIDDIYKIIKNKYGDFIL